jgi:copper(I)-binding protein
MIRRMFAVAAIAALVATTIAACSDAGAKPTVADAWARPSMGMDRAGAAYMTITGGGEADALVGATSPAATTVEIHETVESGGAMAMQPVERIDIPAGGTVKLEPGGYHVMLIDLTGDLVVGEEIEITLEFEGAGEVKVTAEVREGEGM